MSEDNINKILEYIRQVIEFGVDQAPLVAHEVLVWAYVTFAMLASLLAVLCAITLVVLRRLKAIDYQMDDDSFALWLLASSLLVVDLGVVMIVIDSAFDAARAFFAPRLYLLSWVSEIVK